MWTTRLPGAPASSVPAPYNMSTTSVQVFPHTVVELGDSEPATHRRSSGSEAYVVAAAHEYTVPFAVPRRSRPPHTHHTHTLLSSSLRVARSELSGACHGA